MIRQERSEKIRCRVEKNRCRRAADRCGKESPTQQEEARESTSQTTEMEHLNRTMVRINCCIQQQTDDSAVIRVDTEEESEGETKRKAVGQLLIRSETKIAIERTVERSNILPECEIQAVLNVP